MVSARATLTRALIASRFTLTSSRQRHALAGLDIGVLVGGQAGQGQRRRPRAGHRRGDPCRHQPEPGPEPPSEPSAGHLMDRQPGMLGRVAHRSEEHTSELQSRRDLVCRLLLEKKKKQKKTYQKQKKKKRTRIYST